MFPDETSNKKSHILVYIQLSGLKNEDSPLEDYFSLLIRQLGNILMPLTETWNPVSLEQRERGFFVQFKHDKDALDFSLSILERMKEINDFEVGVAIHCGDDVLSAQRENEKLISFAGPNEVVVSETLNLHESQDSHYKWNKVGEIKSEETGNDLDVFVYDMFSETRNQKEDIFQNLKFGGFKLEFVIPLIILVFAGLFFLLPKEKLEPTIAVWMMENRGSSDDDFWVWGITEDITKMLGNSQDIKIVPFDEITTAFSSEDSPEETAKKYGMNYVFISDFNQVKNGVELHYSLINVKNGKSEYSKKLTVSSKQVSDIVGILSRKIMSSLNVNEVEFTESRKTIKPAAYELYLKGKYSINKGTHVDQIDQGISLLEESINLDDNFLHAKSYLANLRREKGDLSKARDLYTEAMTKAGENGDKQRVREYLVSLGDIFLEMDDFSNALECYQNALTLAEELRYRKNSPHIMNQMALIYNNREEPDSAVYYLEKSIKMSHELKDSLSTVSELLFLGNLYYNSKDYYNALIQFGKSLEYSKRIEDTTDISRALHHMSDIFWIKRDYSNAITYQEELLNLLENGHDRSGTAWASFRLGSMYENKCDYDLAATYLKQSLKIRNDMGSKEDIAEVLSYLGIVSMNIEKYKQAQKYFEKAKKIYVTLNDRPGLGFMSHNLGETYFHRGEHRRSEGFFRKAVTIWRELKDPSMEVWSLSWMVLAEMRSGNREFEVDLYLLNKMLKQNEITEQDMPIIHYNIYRVYNKKKLEEEARYHLKTAYNEIMDRVETLQSEHDKNLFLTKNPLNRKIMEAWEKSKIYSE